MNSLDNKEIKINDKFILIEENSKYGYAGEIWNAAYLLSALLLNKKSKNLVKNKTILEIGSGTGICGLFACLCGASKVYLSDRDQFLDILKFNYKLNETQIQENKCTVKIIPLDWNFYPHFKNVEDSVDLIIASDIIYHGVNFQNIITTFKNFSNSKTEIILAYTDRGNSSATEFFDTLQEESNKWVVKKLDLGILDLDEHIKEKSKYSNIYSIKYIIE